MPEYIAVWKHKDDDSTECASWDAEAPNIEEFLPRCSHRRLPCDREHHLHVMRVPEMWPA